jgi:hypothetical protein
MHGVMITDRDDMAETLDLLDVPAGERQAYLDAVPPTTRGLKIGRLVNAFLHPETHDNLTQAERDDTALVVARRRQDELIAALGDARCETTPGPERAAVAWLDAHHGELCAKGEACSGRPHVSAARVTCTGAAGAHVEVDWEQGNGAMGHRSLLLVAAAKTALLLDDVGGATETANGPGVEYVRAISATYHRHGAAMIAVVDDRRDPDKPVLRTFVDGRATAAEAGAFSRASIDGTELDVLYTRDEDPSVTLWHPGEKLTAIGAMPAPVLDPPTGHDRVAIALGHIGARAAARKVLEEFRAEDLEGIVGYREDVLHALALLDADPALVARAAAAAGPAPASLPAGDPSVELGRSYHAAPARQPVDGEIPALAPCVRPTNEERAALTTRVRKWIDTAAPGEPYDPETPPRIAVGCVEADGILVDVQADRLRKGQAARGYWWTLRLERDGAVAILASRAGGLVLNDTESPENQLGALALIDADHDGRLDLVSQIVQHEPGTGSNDYDFGVILAAGGKTILAERFFGIARLIGGDARTAVVELETGGDDEWPPAYRCLDARGMTACPAALAASKKALAAALAADLANGKRSAGDRDAMAEALELLDVPAADRQRWLDAVPLATPGVRAARLVTGFVRPTENLTRQEADDAVRAVGRRWQRELFAALGDAPCQPAPGAEKAATAWILAHEHQLCGKQEACDSKPRVRSASVMCTGPKGSLVDVVWERTQYGGSDGHRTMVFVGAQPALVVDAAAPGGPDRTDSYEFYLDTETHRHGDHVVLVVNDTTPGYPPALHAFVDGKPLATETGSFEDLDTDGTRIEPLFRQGNKLWHAGDKLEVVAQIPEWSLHPAPGGDAVAQALAHAAQRDIARELLKSFDGTKFMTRADYRDDTFLALDLLEADPALVAKLRATLAAPGESHGP